LSAARRIVGIAALLAGLIALAAAPPAATAQQAKGAPAAERPLPSDRLLLVTDTGEHLFTVEIADDPVERARGLMFREQMARHHGMLFDYGAEGERSFWMKNTPIPLDIIFARADGTVVSIARDTVPFSLDSIPSNGPARFAFEVNAGVADSIGLEPGDALVHRRVEK
jgi:uncharacterized membrane protein (UPF0127 family)